MDKPTLPKGTRDFGPAQMAKRQFILSVIQDVFKKYGFQPLETPAMENLSTLTGKYGDEGDQLLFNILNNGDFLKDVESSKLETRNSKLVTPDISGKGLRYDLTVPFARYVVMNRGEITFPFKRFQMQPVWRADRPQKGRYREFYQCDADVVGTDSLVTEAEIILMIKEVFKGLGIIDYTIKINHRDVLAGLAELVGSQGKEADLFVAIDKLDKIGEVKVSEELESKGFNKESIDRLFSTLKIEGDNHSKINRLRVLFSGIVKGSKGLEDLDKVFEILSHYGSPQTNVDFDISLARGLSYYTGTIFEVKVNHVSMGSVSGGGRYDNLTQAFGAKEKLSGVGISFGIDRLYDVMEELGSFPKAAIQFTKILIVHMDEVSMNYGFQIAQSLRAHNIATEIYPDQTKVKKQLDYANKKQIPFAVIVGPDEMTAGHVALKNLNTGDQENLDLQALIEKLK